MVRMFVDHSTEGFVGTVAGTSWGEWTTPKGFDQEGLIIEFEEDTWEFPVHLAGKKSAVEGGIVSVSNLGYFLDALGELGFDTEDPKFDTDILVGEGFLWNIVTVGEGEFERPIKYLPTVRLAPGEPKAETKKEKSKEKKVDEEIAKQDEEEFAVNVLTEVMDILSDHPDGLVWSKISNELIAREKGNMVPIAKDNLEVWVKGKALAKKGNKYTVT